MKPSSTWIVNPLYPRTLADEYVFNVQPAHKKRLWLHKVSLVNLTKTQTKFDKKCTSTTSVVIFLNTCWLKVSLIYLPPFLQAIRCSLWTCSYHFADGFEQSYVFAYKCEFYNLNPCITRFSLIHHLLIYRFSLVIIMLRIFCKERWFIQITNMAYHLNTLSAINAFFYWKYHAV